MSIHQLKVALRATTDPVRRANLRCDLDAAIARAGRAFSRRTAGRLIEAEAGYGKPWNNAAEVSP